MAPSFRGIELFDQKLAFVRQVASVNGHKDVTRDTNGEEILIWTNSNEDPVTLSNFQNGIVKIRLADGRQTGLLTLGWSPKGGPLSMSVSICCPEGKDFALVTTYGKDSGVPYANTILKVPLDGSAPAVLAQHHSDATGPDGYQGQPHGVASDRQFLFDSRENGQNVVYIGQV